jgi:hypothetical protein
MAKFVFHFLTQNYNLFALFRRKPTYFYFLDAGRYFFHFLKEEILPIFGIFSRYATTPFNFPYFLEETRLFFSLCSSKATNFFSYLEDRGLIFFLLFIEEILPIFLPF